MSQASLIIESGVNSSLYSNRVHQIYHTKFRNYILSSTLHAESLAHYRDVNIELIRRTVN